MAACACNKQNAAATATINFFTIALLEDDEPLASKGFVNASPTNDHQVIWITVCMMVLSVEMVLALAW